MKKEDYATHSYNLHDFWRKYDFTIPRWQRDYSWEISNVHEFLNSLYKMRHDSLYIGQLVTAIIENQHDTNRKSISLIDGQQRITTLTMIMHVMLRRLCGKYEKIEADMDDEDLSKFKPDFQKKDNNLQLDKWRI